MKQKKEIGLLSVLLVMAAIVWHFEREKATVGTVSVAQNHHLLSVENPQLHKDKLEAARRTEYQSAGRNIFSAIAPPPATEQSKPVEVSWKTGPPAPPPDPPLQPPPNVKFFGYGTVPNGTARRAFFADGEDVHIVSEGEVLLNRYRILRIGNASLEFEELSSGRRGAWNLNLEDQGSSPPA